ncbi:hypothetical protein C2857_004427 [Epichloe festucae Fl1]|uniref:Zn(2)-C6 fungal-type domain-containing protein n=1 Tax=Epichloe festucae (strain Fl1) TaxID=877507 RepID=A0A7U3Q0Q0_EPIFF|nr:hypothetical protein C2857_004427 [Epichloe festucae Fl1]
MTGDHHRTNKIQHAQPQPLLNPIASHRMYHEQQGSGSMNESSPAVMEGNAFHDFTYPFGGIDQSHMMNMPDVSYGNHIGAAFTQHHGLSSNGPPMTHHISSMSGTPGPAFSSDQGHRGTSLELVEDGGGGGDGSGGGGGGGGGGRDSPAEHSFEDAGTDEFGLPGNNRADGTDLGGRNGDDKSRAPPAWSELKTKAGKDRKRLPLACIACRRKKIRCSGEKPACKHCLRSRIPCVYKVTTRKAAPRTDYMAMLDKRLKRMEDRIIKIIPKPDQDATSFITRAIVRPAVLGANAGNKSASKKRGAEEAFGSDLESWAKAPSSVRVKGAESADADEDSAAKEGSFSADHVLFQEGIDALPPKEIQEHLAEVFFDNVYGQAYHLLHKPSYMRKLKNNTLPPVLVLSVCAVAARFATQSNIAGTARPFLRGEEWASHARDICTRRYEWPNMTVLTCLLILGLHEFGTCHGGRSWALGGQAIRMAFALQLHKDLENDPSSGCGSKVPLSFVDREIRRRIMWACFLMDRFNSSGSDRPMFIKEELIQIQLPVKESYFQLGIPAQTESLDGSAGQSESPSDGQDTPREENMGVAAYTIRAVAIWGRIVAYLHQGRENMEDFALCNERSIYAQLVEQVEDLQRTLPESLKYSVDNLNLHATEKTGSQFLLMHLSIQQNALFLHKAAAARAATTTTTADDGGKDVPSEFLPRASAQTVAAANRISEMLRDAEQAKCNVTAPFAGYCAFSATNMHMFGIFSSNAAVKATAEVNAGINIKFLRKTMRYWGMFHWMVENIRTQYRNALEASRSGKLGTQGLGAWPVLQFADWFNRYPHGVSDFDVVEPTVQRRRERGEDAVLEQKPELQSVEDYFTSLASPSSTEGGGPPPPPASKRKQMTKKSSESAGNSNSNNNSNNNHLNNGKAIDGAGQSTAGPRAAASRQLSVSGGGGGSGQANGPASAGYNHHHPVGGRPGPGPLSHVHTHQQPYNTAMSPMSPVQTSPFPPPGPGQSPFFAPDMLQMNGMGHRGSADLSPNLDSPHVSFGYGLSSGGQNMMDSSAATWQQAKNASDTNKMLHHNQQAVKVNGGHAPTRHLHNQGQIGADGLVEFNGSDLPAGWVMPFSIDPRADLQDMSIPREGEASHGAADAFNSIFGSTGVGIHQSMASLHAHGG